VILEGLNQADEATLVADKIERAMDEPIPVQDGVVQTSTSIGVAVFDGGAGTGSALLDKADQALYTAKRAGRATFHVTTF
jgi:diguanylate cyclase (GGDEF)-like protein